MRILSEHHNIMVQLVTVTKLKSVRIHFQTPVKRAAELAGQFGACAVHTKPSSELLERYLMAQ